MTISRRLFLRCSAATALAAALLRAPGALAAGWELLGRRDVPLVADHDAIPVTAARGGFRRIQLRVHGNGIFINNLTVIYGNGVSDDIPIRAEIPQGGQSRVIDLRGGDRIIRSIQLSYRAKRNFKGHAKVEVWGRD